MCYNLRLILKNGFLATWKGLSMKIVVIKISFLLFASCAFVSNLNAATCQTPNKTKCEFSTSAAINGDFRNEIGGDVTINKNANITINGNFENSGVFTNNGGFTLTGTGIFYNNSRRARFESDAKATNFYNSATFEIYGARLEGAFSQVTDRSSVTFGMLNGKMGSLDGDFSSNGGSVYVDVAGMDYDTKYAIIIGNINNLNSSNLQQKNSITQSGYKLFYDGGYVWLGKESDPNNPSPTKTPPENEKEKTQKKKHRQRATLTVGRLRTTQTDDA